MKEEIKNIIKKISDEARGIFKSHESKINNAHGWDHVERVRGLSIKISKIHNSKFATTGNKVNLEEIEITALLHDIGRYKDEEGEHAEWSYKLAQPILEKFKNKLSNINTDKILNLIRNHTFYKKEQCYDKEIFDDIEFRILTDADKIDSFGPIGILRAPLDPRFKTIEDQIQHINDKANPEKFPLRSEAGQEVGNRYKQYLGDFFDQYISQADASKNK